MEFSVFHAYRRLSRRGMVEPLTCPDCNYEYVVVIKDEEPALECFSCGGLVIPGLRLYDEIRAVVKEYDVS